jgi:hypothetical protein
MKLTEIIDQAKATGMNILCHSVNDDQQIWVCPKFPQEVVGFPLGVNLNYELLTVSQFGYYSSIKVNGMTWKVTHEADDYLIDELFPVVL